MLFTVGQKNRIDNRQTDITIRWRAGLIKGIHPGAVLLGILGGYVPPSSPNPDPISYQKL